MARPPKLPLPAQLVVWAAREIVMTDKAVWYHTWFLDQGGEDGCYIGARSMAARLGISERTVEDARSRLVRLFLLVRWTRPEGREKGYRATLPQSVQPPRTFKEATAELSAALDAHVLALAAGPTATTYSEPRQGRTQNHGRDVLTAEGASRKGGRGEGASSVQSEGQLPSAVEDAEEAREGNGLKRPGTAGSSERVGDVLSRLNLPRAS